VLVPHLGATTSRLSEYSTTNHAFPKPFVRGSDETPVVAVQNNAPLGVVAAVVSPSTKPKRRSASGYYGVSASTSGSRWEACCQKRYLGTFDTKQEAALAYDREVMQRGWPVRNFESIEEAEAAAEEANPGHQSRPRWRRRRGAQRVLDGGDAGPIGDACTQTEEAGNKRARVLQESTWESSNLPAVQQNTNEPQMGCLGGLLGGS
jgi:hypothetical protein